MNPDVLSFRALSQEQPGPGGGQLAISSFCKIVKMWHREEGSYEWGRLHFVCL